MFYTPSQPEYGYVRAIKSVTAATLIVKDKYACRVQNNPKYLSGTAPTGACLADGRLRSSVTRLTKLRLNRNRLKRSLAKLQSNKKKLTVGLRLTSRNNERGDQGENKLQRKSPPTLRTSLGRHWWEKKKKKGRELALPPPPSPYTTLTRSAGVIYHRFCSPNQRDIMPDTAPITAAQTEQLCPFASQTTTTRRLCGVFIDRGTK